MAVSAVHTGWGHRAAGGRVNSSDVSAYYNGTEILRSSASATTFPLATTFSLGVTITAGGLTVTAGDVVTNGSVTLANDQKLTLGTGGDSVLYHRSTALGANTSVTGVLVGTPVAQAVAADSLLLSNVTADGDIAMYTQTGGNSDQFLFADASAKVLYFGQTGWAVNILDGAVKLTLGTVSAFGTTQPTNTLVLRAGTAPAGAITTAVGLFTDGTSMKKIIADGTVSNVET